MQLHPFAVLVAVVIRAVQRELRPVTATAPGAAELDEVSRYGVGRCLSSM